MTADSTGAIDANSGPKARPVAYILLWFPKASETFIFAEVTGLWRLGMTVEVFSLYARCEKDLSPEMLEALCKVHAMGVRAAWRLPVDFGYWLFRKPRVVMGMLRKILFRRWRDLEQVGENIWAFFCGFHLARRLANSEIQHIHAPWANGPATAAWVASILTGIPFSFSARAGDIYPQDGALADKINAAVFVRSENRVNVDYLAQFVGNDRSKICAVYNPLPMHGTGEAAVRMSPPVQILAVGRFVRIKGFNILLRAVADLRDRGESVHVTLVGDGWLRVFLERQIRRLGLEANVSLPGFMTYETMSGYYERSDLFVMPSVIVNGGDRDGLPTVILEAMAHRLPVIASDVCGIKEVVINNRTGWLVPAGDPAALAGAIKDAIGNRDRALALASAGRALVLAEFDPARNLGKMAELLAGASAGL